MSILELVERYLAEGEEGKARDITLRHRLAPGQNLEAYLRWAKICEDLNLPRQALECYDKALAINPHHPKALYDKAALFYEIGHLDSAKRLLLRLLQVNPSEKAHRLLMAVYKELKEVGSLEVLSHAERENRPEEIRYFPPSLGKSDLEPLYRLFKGRKGYDEIILHPNTGAPVRLRFRQPITDDLLRKHLLGEKFLAFYPLSEDVKLKQAILNIGIPTKVVAKHVREKSWLYLSKEAVKYQAISALQRVRRLRLPGALEIVSDHQYRLWFFFKEPVHLLWVKRFLRILINFLPYPSEGVQFQPWLPTKGVGIGWVERSLWMPLGVLPTTKRRLFFVDEDGEPYPEQLKFLKQIREISWEEVRYFCQGSELRWERRLDRRLDQLLEDLRRACPILGAIIQKAQAGRLLHTREKQALFLTVGLLDHEGHLLHEVLHPCADYKYSHVERQRRALPPNPLSCIKLRAWFPDLANSLPCHCVFDLTEGRYPSPLLHVAPILVPTEEERFSLKRTSVKELAKIYLHTRQDMQLLSQKLKRLEEELGGYLKARPGKMIQVENYILTYEDESLKIKPGVKP